MARRPMFDRPKSSKQPHTRLEKMRMSHLRTQKEIQRIHAETAQRTTTKKPLHLGQPPRR